MANMEYKICENSSVGRLEKAVNVSITNGWVPQGGMTYQPETKYDNKYYMQAMVKIPPKPVPKPEIQKKDKVQIK